MNEEEYHQWISSFIKSRAVKNVLQSFASLKPTNIELLKYRALKACYLAHTYDKDADQNYLRRASDKKFYRLLDSHLNDIKRVQRFIESNSTECGNAFALALLHIKDEVSINCKPMESHRLLLCLLEAYESKLNGQLLGVRAGPFLHRVQLGNLIYRKPIDNQSRTADPKIDGLLFELTLHFRQATQCKPLRLQAGITMPAEGRPCYRQVALLANEAIGTSLTPNKVRYRVRALTNLGVGLTIWPHQ